jgi:geranylgeranyl pyrophosphate synthase
MTTAPPDIDLAALIADTEGEIVSLVRDRDPSTHGMYEMVRYHLALDGSGASGGKRMRPLLGLLAYASISNLPISREMDRRAIVRARKGGRFSVIPMSRRLTARRPEASAPAAR